MLCFHICNDDASLAVSCGRNCGLFIKYMTIESLWQGTTDAAPTWIHRTIIFLDLRSCCVPHKHQEINTYSHGHFYSDSASVIHCILTPSLTSFPKVGHVNAFMHLVLFVENHVIRILVLVMSFILCTGECRLQRIEMNISRMYVCGKTVECRLWVTVV